MALNKNSVPKHYLVIPCKWKKHDVEFNAYIMKQVILYDKECDQHE